jgi:hypothetical protein
MFEKHPVATMNNRKISLTERWVVDARELAGKATLNDASRRFASYLCVLGNFFVPLIAESYWGAARLLSGCCGRFPTAPAHVAFL